MAKKFAQIFGVVFVLVGLLGFVPNPIVSDMGLFHTDMIHNLVHIISGIIFLWVAMSMPMRAAMTLKVFGVVYLLVAVLGFLMTSAGATSEVLGFISVDGADNWLHLVLGLVIFAAGFAKSDGMSMPMSDGAA